MGSFEVSPEQAVASALRIIKEGRAHGVKLEGDSALVPAIQRLTQAGIPVVGHVGLTPQRRHLLGGFKVQGKSADSALRSLDYHAEVTHAHNRHRRGQWLLGAGFGPGGHDRKL